MKKPCLVLFFLSFFTIVYGQEQVELLPFGDFESWTVRNIKESFLIGGKTKDVFMVAPNDTISENEAYDYSETIWGVSNVYANVLGVVKAANSLYPERRGDGWCARLDTKMEVVKVLGLVDIKVAVAGSIFLGKVVEPVRSASDPYERLSLGIPFTKRPKALKFDFKSKISPENTHTKATGLGVSEIEGHDQAQIYLYLQKRWEDEDGNIFAKRIGTIYHRIPATISEWENDYRLEIFYGDNSKSPSYNPMQGLLPVTGEYMSENSWGEQKIIQEIGWAEPDETPTHIFLMFSSGCQMAFHGHLGNSLWIDNIRLVY